MIRHRAGMALGSLEQSNRSAINTGRHVVPASAEAERSTMRFPILKCLPPALKRGNGLRIAELGEASGPSALHSCRDK
jgi:hypothetical protein